MLEWIDALGRIVASVLATGMIVATSFGLGSALLRALRLETSGLVERGTWSVTLGLCCGGMLLALLGVCGLLYAPLIGGLTVIGTAWGLGQLFRNPPEPFDDVGKTARTIDSGSESVVSPPKWLQLGLAVVVLFVGMMSVIAALAPPTAGDALCYHLELPKAFLAEHRLVHLPYHDNSTFPLLGEMWFAWGLALEGPITAQLVSWCCGWLLAGATYVLAVPFLGRDWGRLTGMLVLLVPGINNHMAAPLVDVPTALLATLMLAAWLRATREEEPANWLIVSGGLLGAALAVKYVALVFAVAWGLVAVVDGWRRSDQRRDALRRIGVVVVVAASVAGPWYVRTAFYRGDPVWPFLSAWLPSVDSPPETVDKTRLGLQPANVALAPWLVTMRPEEFGGRGHRLGPIFLMLLPALFAARRLRGLAGLLAMATVYAAGWYLLRQNVRFLYPIVPLLLVAAGWSFVELARWPAAPRRLAITLVAMLVLLDASGPLRRARDKFAVALGTESRTDYLLRSEPTYRAACVANAISQGRARILSQDYRAFYFDAAVTRESIYRRITRFDKALSGESLSKQLRRRGFTHLLLVSAAEPQGAGFDSTLAGLVDRQRRHETWATRQLVCLDDYDFVDAEGVTRNYRLIELR